MGLPEPNLYAERAECREYNLNTDNIELTNLAGKYAGVTTPKTEFHPGSECHTACRMTRSSRGIRTQLFHESVWCGIWRSRMLLAHSTEPNRYTDQPLRTVGFHARSRTGITGYSSSVSAEWLDLICSSCPAVPIFRFDLGDYPHSYNDTYNVTLEHAFAHRITASIAYVGNRGRHLWDNVDMNACARDLTSAVPSIRTVRFYYRKLWLER